MCLSYRGTSVLLLSTYVIQVVNFNLLPLLAKRCLPSNFELKSEKFNLFMLFSFIYCGLDKSVGSTHLGAVGQRPVDSTPLLDGAILPILPTAGQVTHCACASLKIFSQSVNC